MSTVLDGVGGPVAEHGPASRCERRIEWASARAWATTGPAVRENGPRRLRLAAASDAAVGESSSRRFVRGPEKRRSRCFSIRRRIKEFVNKNKRIRARTQEATEPMFSVRRRIKEFMKKNKRIHARTREATEPMFSIRRRTKEFMKKNKRIHARTREATERSSSQRPPAGASSRVTVSSGIGGCE